MKKSIRRNLALSAIIICSSIGAAQVMAAEKPTADVSMLASSKYVWRGFELSDDSIVLQPSATVGYKGFSANLWGNLDTNVNGTPSGNNWTETDMTLAYDWAMGPVGLTAGYIYYGLDAANDSQEFFVSAVYDVLLSPTLTVYRDFDAYPGWYTTIGVSYSVPLKGAVTLDLGAQAGYLAADDVSTYAEINGSTASPTEAYLGLHDGVLSAAITFPINEYVSITPSLNYSFALTGDSSDMLAFNNSSGDDSFIYGGVAASFSF